MKIQEYLKDHILLFDGAMGTYFESLNKQRGAGCELSSISQPDIISSIHKVYIEAGCNAIKTNTFCVNRMFFQDEELVKKCIDASWNIALDAIHNKDVYVFADIGPIQNTTNGFDEYKFVVDCFIEKGATNFIFETHTTSMYLKEISNYIHEQIKDAFVITSFCIQPDGFSRDGIHIEDLVSECKDVDSIDCIGMNCGSGVHHILELFKDIQCGKPFMICPNAGYPIILNNRTYYDGNPDYFASQILECANHGAKIIGGCCGTTPFHIQRIHDTLLDHEIVIKDTRLDASSIDYEDDIQNRFYDKLVNKEKVIAVELDSPSNWNLSKFMDGAKELKDYVDVITIADCPIGRARMDSSLLACKVKRELDLDVIPHMTCRDRNLNATKALLLGSHAEGIRNVLLITGDPIPSSERDEVKTVYQFNSRKLAAYIRTLEEKNLMGHFNLFGALNVNAINFDVQLRLAKEKIENGMVGFLTQPVLTKRALENLKRAYQELDAFILGGIIPVVSYRNAVFMENEINGIQVDPDIIEMYKDKNREEAEDLATSISLDYMKQMEDFVDGFYLMTPFGRTSLISRIIKKYKGI